MRHNAHDAPIPLRETAGAPAWAWRGIHRLESRRSAETPVFHAPLAFGAPAVNRAARPDHQEERRGSHRGRRRSWLSSRALLAIIIVGLFGLLGVAGIALALGIRRQRARHGWTHRATCTLAIAVCAALLVIAPFAPTVQAQHATTAVTAPDTRIETMATLFTLVNQIPSSGPPMRIVTVGPRGDNTILVMLRSKETDRLWGAVKAAMGLPGDPVAGVVREAFEQYRHAQRLPAGTTVILAGHSFGGIVAQEIASDPHATDFRVAAVVTWGAPDMGGHVAGVTYQRYFSQYDPVPMLSAHQLAMPLLWTGPLGTLSALLVMQESPGLKAMFTGQTYVPDMGRYWSPLDWIHTDGSWDDAHNGYGGSAWLDHQVLTYARGGKRLTLTFI